MQNLYRTSQQKRESWQGKVIVCHIQFMGKQRILQKITSLLSIELMGISGDWLYLEIC
jgi:hypothetical protein